MSTSAEIHSAIQAFGSQAVAQAAIGLLSTLGYQSDKHLDVPSSPDGFFDRVDTDGKLNRANAHLQDWESVHFLFQLTNDEIPSLAYGQTVMISGDNSYQKGLIGSFVYVAIELNRQEWSRSDLAKITREVNKAFPMPVIVLFRHGGLISLAVIDRRVNKRDASLDVIDNRRIAIIKDIKIGSPHRAHVEILNDFALKNLDERHTPSNFRDLYEAYIRVLSVKELNKRFYNELYDWYWWSVRECEFPNGQVWETEPTKREAQKSVAVIRLLTRLIFVWFIKEKDLVPEKLFRLEYLTDLLKESPTAAPEKTTYYKAILQNLFFSTLNTEPGENGERRRWKSESTGQNSHYLVHTVYRYRNMFRNPDEALEAFRSIPFLNGGLFECLDREITDRDRQRNPELEDHANREGDGLILRIDGFSDRNDNQLKIPNKLFFAREESVDLGDNARSKKGTKANGLIEIFERYKFTIEENTPIEEEVALDPELLGKVFENLLASYNEDTKNTARKQSGSFYTPREVVDYMVDEALIAYAAQPLADTENKDAKLKKLLSFGVQTHDFTPAEVVKLIEAIENLKSLDPACGSGAFPMGMLQKLVHVLGKLDPDNAMWKAQNRAPLERQRQEAESIPDPNLREKKTEEAEEELRKLDRAFSDRHYADYSRKLYLVEKCLFGVDIQPIAVQITKLRFFISLVVSQKVDPAEANLNITPLPNLETKLVAANTLIPIERPAQLTIRDLRIDVKEDELRIANERHFAARTTKTKRKYRERITDLRDELAALLQQDDLLSKESAKQLVAWEPFDQNTSAGFFDPEWMFGLHGPNGGGFDIVIGNPPYVRQEELNKPFSQKPNAEPLKLVLEKFYSKPKKKKDESEAVIADVYSGTADLYVYFYARSFHLLKPNGTLAFITSNKWYRASYGQKLREWMAQNVRLRRIIDFGDEAVFTALAYPTIVIATRCPSPVREWKASDELQVLNWQSGPPVESFTEVFAEQSFAIPQAELLPDGWQLERPYKRDLLARIRDAGPTLGDWCKSNSHDIHYGIKTGFNDAFVIPSKIKKQLIDEDENSEKIIKPFLRGRDIKRWWVEPSSLWLIKIESSENKTHPWSHLEGSEAEESFATNYSAIYNWMQQYRPGLDSRSDQGRFYWELRSCGYWKEFEGVKIVYPDIATVPKFAYDTKGHYLGNTGYLIPDGDKYLLAVLNCPVTAWFYSQVCSQIQGGYLRMIYQSIVLTPIPSASELQKSVVRACVEIILDTPNGAMYWEQLLNGLIYELFFPDDLQARNIRLFDEMERLNFLRAGDTQPDDFVEAALHTSAVIFRNDHPIYHMMFDLQTVDVVRIIEGK